MKNQKSKLVRKKGFTLLEILVVLTIMGFLIAMVAPRLAGVSGDAVDTVCDTNQNRMVGYMSSYFERKARFPNKMTNLVQEDSATAPNYAVLTVSDGDPENGVETLAAEFDDRNHFKIHILDADEAAQLRGLGIVTLLNLNAYDNSSVVTANQEASMNPVTPAAGVGVAMVGIGHNATAWDLESTERGWGEPDWFGRIVLGLGPECGLITSGVIANAAHCPGGIQNTDNCTYNDYNLVLPRLEATVDRFDTDGDGDVDSTDAAALGFGATVDPTVINAVAYDDEPAAAYDYTANGDNLRVRTFDISEVQESWQYATQCPEGHMYPEDDGEFWGIDIDGATGIN